MQTPRRSLSAVAALLLPFAGCQSTVREVPAAPYVAYPVFEVERFEVRQGERVVGYVRHLEIQDPAEPLRYWRIESARGAWVGHATEQGRFSRRVPFEQAEQDLGIWPLRRGVAELLEVEGPIVLAPIAPEGRSVPGAAEAAAPRTGGGR